QCFLLAKNQATRVGSLAPSDEFRLLRPAHHVSTPRCTFAGPEQHPGRRRADPFARRARRATIRVRPLVAYNPIGDTLPGREPEVPPARLAASTSERCRAELGDRRRAKRHGAPVSGSPPSVLANTWPEASAHADCA